MNLELQAILNYIEKERGLDRETLIKAVEYALQSAARKIMGSDAEYRISIDRKSCDIRAFAEATVVEKAPRGNNSQVSLAKAKEIKPDAALGDVIEVEVTPKNLGRIAAQTAKQAIIQKIRQAEREMVFDEYKDRVGDIISGAVHQFNRRDIVVDLGRCEAIIPENERVPTEDFQIGDRIRAYVLSVEENASGPAMILSRSHPDFVRALFMLEVSEINDGIVEIKAIAREPGYRTKIAVASSNEKVDPVGACVGMRGIRVKNIVMELSGEKIDIIRWNEDIRTYVTNALSPAKLQKIEIDPEVPNTINVVCDQDQLSLAIGKRGQNVRLTSRLVGWRINIQKDESQITFEEKKVRAIERMSEHPGITGEQAQQLVEAGFLTMEGILAVDLTEFTETTGLDESVAKTIYEIAAAGHTTEDE